jgi:hypothetical protein
VVENVLMEFEFDKEIEALLRQTAKGETVFAAEANPQSAIRNPQSNHLDADEISAFAENALPETAQRKYTMHFADCDRCRKILSNLITLNSEAETISASSAVAPKIVETAKASWYRRLFAFPNLAYAMGGLVVLFGGFLAFTVLQNTGDLQNTEVSQISESQPVASGPGFESEPDFFASNSTANTSNTPITANSNMMMSNSASSNSSAISMNASTNTTTRISNANTTANAASVKKEAAAGNEAQRETQEDSAKNEPKTQTTDVTATFSADGMSFNEKKVAERPQDDERTKAAQAPPTAALAKPSTPKENDKKDSIRAKSRKLETSDADAENRQIGDKNFKRSGGVWYDSNYKGQSTTNVRRGSNEYKNLDSGLRSIAENLSGTVVIVWKSKAYRIQ